MSLSVSLYVLFSSDWPSPELYPSLKLLSAPGIDAIEISAMLIFDAEACDGEIRL